VGLNGSRGFESLSLRREQSERGRLRVRTLCWNQGKCLVLHCLEERVNGNVLFVFDWFVGVYPFESLSLRTNFLFSFSKQGACENRITGRMTERSNVTVLKTVEPEMVPRVRIPVLPHYKKTGENQFFCCERNRMRTLVCDEYKEIRKCCF
jgi:hypothetical protein